MARRGVMTALQAALAGISGAAGGYVQMEERKRKQLEEQRQREREEARDLVLYGREAITPGPLATRVPAGLPKPDMPAGAPPSAIPMPTGPVDFGGAMRQLEQEEAVPSGTQAIKIGNQTLYVPVGQRYRDIKRSETLQAEQSALDAAIARAKAEGQVKREFGEEDFQNTNKRDFDTFKALGGRGEYRPSVVYSRMITDLGADKALAGQRSLIEARIGAAGAGAQAGAPKPGERGPLPTVVNTASQLDKMDVRDVLKLRPAGIAAATQAPLTLAETRGGFSGLLALPTVAAMNLYANAQEQDYAMMIRATADAVARASEKGVLTDRDIGRFQSQVMMLPGDNDDTTRTKFNNLKAWSKWLAGDNTNAPLPGESAEERQLRLAPMRANTTATGQTADAELQEDRRLWDQAVAKYGRARVEREYGPRP